MLRVAIIGPGAIGCAVGAAIAEKGSADLLVCSRRPFPAFELSNSDGTTSSWPARCETDPSQVGSVDIVLLCTKAHQTMGAAPWLAATVGANTLVAVLQNGVDHRERVQPLVGEAEILPVIVEMPTTRTAPGRIERGDRADLIVAAGDAGDRLRSVFAGTFVNVVPSDDWLTCVWMKLIVNAASGAISAITRRSNLVFADAEAARLVRDLMEEIAAVGRAEGAILDFDAAEKLAESVRAGASDRLCSIAVDQIAGRPTEWRARNEVVVRLAARHGIAVPLNRTMTSLLRLAEGSGTGT